MKRRYAQLLEQYYNVKKIFSPSYIHPEEEPDIEELNDNVKCIAKDIESIDASFIDAGIKIKNLLDNTKLKLKTVHDYLSAEKERQEDVNILCNRYTEFAKPKNINLENAPAKDTVEISKPAAQSETKAPAAADKETVKETQSPKDTAPAAATNPIVPANVTENKPADVNAKKLDVVA